MDSPFMNTVAELVATAGVSVVRFEFDYMAKRRTDGTKRPPPRAPKLIEEYRAVLAELGTAGHWVIGGKSMGGRIASMIADEAKVRGLVCLGYPFHPPGKPDSLRTSHLEALRTPALFCQGTRDPFGAREEVTQYALSSAIEFAWIEDGEHSWKPRRKSGRTEAQNLETGAEAIAAFIRVNSV